MWHDLKKKKKPTRFCYMYKKPTIEPVKGFKIDDVAWFTKIKNKKFTHEISHKICFPISPIQSLPFSLKPCHEMSFIYPKSLFHTCTHRHCRSASTKSISRQQLPFNHSHLPPSTRIINLRTIPTTHSPSIPGATCKSLHCHTLFHLR